MNALQEITFSDFLSLYGIYLSFKNLELNLTQSDKQELMQELDAKTTQVLNRIEQHLEKQDAVLQKLQERVFNDNT